jgi:hypothetical protein
MGARESHRRRFHPWGLKKLRVELRSDPKHDTRSSIAAFPTGSLWVE